MKNKHEIIDVIIELSLYIYIFFMFLARGEGIRNVLLLGSFVLWLSTIRHRKDLGILKGSVPKFFWLYAGVTVLFVVFSIDPLYSFTSLRNDPIKPMLLFIMVATVMSTPERLKRLLYLSFSIAALMVFAGYYSYFINDMPVLKPDTYLIHTGHTGGHNKFARYLNLLMPFVVILYLSWNKRKILKILPAGLLVLSMVALVLTTSREGYLAFAGIMFTWALFFSITRKYNFFKIISFITAMMIIAGSLAWFTVPSVKERLATTLEHLPTMNMRTEAWVPAIYAIGQRPLVGWGYGDRIFREDEPYKNTPYGKAPERTSPASPKGMHNTFITVLFHQGIIGGISYILLVLGPIYIFWKKAVKRECLQSYILVACVSVLMGNYILNAILADPQFCYMALLLGIGTAAGEIA